MHMAYSKIFERVSGGHVIQPGLGKGWRLQVVRSFACHKPCLEFVNSVLDARRLANNAELRDEMQNKRKGMIWSARSLKAASEPAATGQAVEIETSKCHFCYAPCQSTPPINPNAVGSTCIIDAIATRCLIRKSRRVKSLSPSLVIVIIAPISTRTHLSSPMHASIPHHLFNVGTRNRSFAV